MKILLIEWKSFGTEDLLDAYEQLGHTVIRLPIPRTDYRSNPEFEKNMTASLRKEVPDYVFSFNYFPAAAKVCHRENIPYVSWIYDSPYVLLYSFTTIYPTNYIYVFDKKQCLEFRQAGINTVHYLPMAANTARLEKMTPDTLPENQKNILPHTGISFIGSMYTEKHTFFDRLTGISDYTRGYLDSIMAAQQKVYGYNFIQEMLTPDIVRDMQQFLPLEPNEDGVETTEYLFAQYVINRKITSMERQHLLRLVGEHYQADLYTADNTFSLPGVRNHGPVDYYDTAPYIFKNSKINLNISLRSILSGIPLRAFDIMGAGGFLLTNYQEDFNDFFIPGEDYAFFDSENDLLDKVSYYLSHDEERACMAANAFRKIAASHTYVHRIQEWEARLN